MFLKTLLVLTIVFAVSQAIGPNVVNPRYLSSPKPSCADIKFIVDFHNTGRRKLANGTLDGQPKASKMETVVWDEELAEIAYNYTQKMIFAHNPDRKSKRFSVGENLFMTTSSNSKNTKVEWQRPLNAWFNEYKVYDFQPALEDPATAHYTQFVWADTTYIGCGTTQFLDSQNVIYKYYVCNYGPSGNWYGDFPYVEDTGDEIAELISAGELPPGFEIPEQNNDLVCDKNQCDKMYGLTCKM